MAPNDRSNSPARSIGQLLADEEAAFGRVLRRARALERLNRRVLDLLDEGVARHCQVANVRDRRLIFACTSPSFATRLRMQSAELLERLQQAGLEGLEGIEVRVVPEQHGWRGAGE